MTEALDGQEQMFDLDTWSGRTYQEPSAPTREKTSRLSSRKSSGSRSRTLPTFQCLRGGGLTADATTLTWEDGALPTAPWTPSSSEPRRDDAGLLCWPISTGSQQQIFCLTLNCGERPRKKNETWLRQVLAEADDKYKLSATACQGILNRASRRGKELPPELKEALEKQARDTGKVESNACGQKGKTGQADHQMSLSKTTQSACKETELTEPIPQGVTARDGVGVAVTPLTQSTDPQLSVSRNEPENLGGKGILIQIEHTGALSTVNNQSVLTENHPNEQQRESGDKEETLRAESQVAIPMAARKGAYNPWDSQSERVYPIDEPWHSINANESGGQSRDAVFVDVYNQSIDGEVAASITAATGGTNTSGPKVMVFAQNQRDEVRDLNGVAGSLAAEPGMKQQTFVCASVDCRNGKENELCNGTLQSKGNGGTSVNLNNVVRVKSCGQ